MKNNNSAVVRRISNRSLKNNRMRNLLAVMAICLTSMLFTAVFSMGIGLVQVTQEQTMREVGGKFHAGLKHVTMEQYEKITDNPLVKKRDYNIFLGFAENILKRSAELRYVPEEENLAGYFIELAEGHYPQKEDEIIVDTIVMDELKIPHQLGVKVPLTFTFMGEKVEKEFTVSGWYEGDYISHASELFLSETYWKELRGTYTDDDFVQWGQGHLRDNGIGLVQGNVMFANARNIERNIRTIIEDAGYVPEEQIEYGVNWAYMSNRLEGIDVESLVLLAAALLVILLTGYLIIYNIFQISIMNDIRFYGLLKTIGTTKKQIKKMVRRQAVCLSVIGIPLGLLLGYLSGKLLLPFMTSFMDYRGMEISLKMNPYIFLFGALFSLFTVFISCRKPGKIAGSVSPIEAVKYTENGIKRKRGKKSESGARLSRMAFSNLGRNKKKTAAVICSLSLSIILLAMVMTAVGSFRMDSFLEARIAGDFTIGSVDYTTTYRGMGFAIDQDYIQAADHGDGIKEKNEMWTSTAGMGVNLSNQAMARLQEFDRQGKLSRDKYSTDSLDQVLAGENPLKAHYYGYSVGLLKNLKVLKGELNIEKFQKGGYILVGRLNGSDECTSEDMLYEPGDKISLNLATENTQMEEIKNKEGETVGVEYNNQDRVEYEVMAVVNIPISMDVHMYASNSLMLVLPEQDFTKNTKYSQMFAVSYQVEKEKQKAFEQVLVDYTENINPQMGYTSKDSLREEFSGMIGVIGTVGIALSGVIALIGILNFINSMVTGIIARKREFAVMQSIGMTNGQLEKMLLFEGIYYIAISGVISIITGSLLTYGCLKALNQVLMFFQYRYTVVPYVIMLVIFFAVAVVVPILAYQKAKKTSVVERLRDAE